MIYFTWEWEEDGRRGAKSSLPLWGFLQSGQWGGELGGAEPTVKEELVGGVSQLF